MAVALTGCGPSPEESARIQHQMDNPIVTVVGTFDDCEVKFVNRYYRDSSFYLARCGQTAAATRQFSEMQGRQSVPRTRLSITDVAKSDAAIDAAEVAQAKEDLARAERKLAEATTALTIAQQRVDATQSK